MTDRASLRQQPGNGSGLFFETWPSHIKTESESV